MLTSMGLFCQIRMFGPAWGAAALATRNGLQNTQNVMTTRYHEARSALPIAEPLSALPRDLDLTDPLETPVTPL